ncbi:MAG: hypothetical protein HY342_12045 [Candidatus Lambdaproteobacteria bacterium]|nr:hypothetical protein [Candidatus Lambdaproteobacteria bacterium]
MTEDIFEFWSEIGRGDSVHPRDIQVMSRVDHVGKLNLDCLPACFSGPLKTARIVLLFLNPGLSERDITWATTDEGRDYYQEKRRGSQPLSGPDGIGFKFWTSHTKDYGEWRNLRNKIAKLNISGYHSTKSPGTQLLAALPSSRVTLDWAQQVLFPQAITGERVVVCLRAKRFWGLDAREQHGKALFAPEVTRGGRMKEGKMKQKIIRIVKAAIASSN